MIRDFSRSKKYCIANRRNLIDSLKEFFEIRYEEDVYFLFLKSRKRVVKGMVFTRKKYFILEALEEVARNLHFPISTPILFISCMLKLDILDLSILHSFELVEQNGTTSFIFSKNLRSPFDTKLLNGYNKLHNFDLKDLSPIFKSPLFGK